MRVNLHILSPSSHHFAAKISRRVTMFSLMIKAASLEHVLRVLSLTLTIAVGRVPGIDGSFLKHGRYKSIMLTSVGRTGNGSNIILAVGICDGEGESNCDWFLRHFILAGVKIEGSPTLCDRGRGRR